MLKYLLNLGYKDNELSRFDKSLALSNLKLLLMYCQGMRVTLLITAVAFCLDTGIYLHNTVPYLIEVIYISLILVATKKRLKNPEDNSFVKDSNILTFLFVFSLYVLCIYNDCIVQNNNISVMLCLAFFGMPIMFDCYPDNCLGIASAAFLMAWAVMRFTEPPEILYKNIFNIMFSGIFGIILSWIKTHNRFGVFILQERELIVREKENQVGMMMSQLVPHFLYNTLSTISTLCDIDPERAKDVTDKFSAYLRGNIDAIGKNDYIPFKKELEHIKNYLSLEQVRFGDKLKVVYQIGFDDFEVVPLLVQPIVENAVKHGVCNKKCGGTVWISTERNIKNIIITVRDNGVGVNARSVDDIPENDGRSHLGVKITRDRVESMLGGEMTFEGREGEGVTVRLKLPADSTHIHHVNAPNRGGLRLKDF